MKTALPPRYGWHQALRCRADTSEPSASPVSELCRPTKQTVNGTLPALAGGQSSGGPISLNRLLASVSEVHNISKIKNFVSRSRFRFFSSLVTHPLLRQRNPTLIYALELFEHSGLPRLSRSQQQHLQSSHACAQQQ